MNSKVIAARKWAEQWLVKPKQNYINGQWVDGSSDKNFEVINPADQSLLCTLKLADSQQIKATAKAANNCHQKKLWAKKSRIERANILREIAKLIDDNLYELAVLETLPNGKLIKESLVDDIPTCVGIFDYYAGWTDKYYGVNSPVEDDFINFTREEPIGVCALIAPWNYPLYQASLKIAPALAMGNPIILKPSEFTAFSSLYLFELIDKHIDLPDGTINLLLADGENTNALTLSDDVHKVSFTGSTPVGRKIIQNSGQSNLKAATLELGGKSPCIFFADTPALDKAIERAFYVMFSQKGEKCSEPTRFLLVFGYSEIQQIVTDLKSWLPQ